MPPKVNRQTDFSWNLSTFAGALRPQIRYYQEESVRKPNMKKTAKSLILASSLTLALSSQLLTPCSALPPGSWEQVQSKGEKAAYACEYGDAERLLKYAVNLARTFPAGDVRLAKSDGELGRLLTIRGRFAEAEPYLEEELAVKTVACGSEDEQLIPAMSSLVHFYLNHGTAGKATPLAEKILAFVEGKLSQASTQAQGKITLKAGMPLQAWAGEASPVMRDPLIEWAIACDDIGNIYGAREDFAMAERLFKAALNIKSTVLGKQHLSLANSYDSLGSLALARKDNEDAESYLKDALDITERIQPPEHYQVYARLDKLGRCLIQQGKLAEAEALYLRAQGLWQAAPSRNGNEGRAMFALANVYAQEKKYAEAAPLFEQALRLAEVHHGPDSVALVPYLERYAYALYYLDSREQVAQLKERARIIAESSRDDVLTDDEAVAKVQEVPEASPHAISPPSLTMSKDPTTDGTPQ